MISIEALSKIIDSSQLTSDLDGSLSYDHATWLETRLAVEEFAWQAADLLDRLDDLQEDLARNDFADDVSGAKHKIDLHNEMKKKIMKAPVEDINMQGERSQSVGLTKSNEKRSHLFRTLSLFSRGVVSINWLLIVFGEIAVELIKSIGSEKFAREMIRKLERNSKFMKLFTDWKSF